ncbi:hypothetical protein [Corynebacterium ulceribovis]|uniref:hypothetical protein n=1 Tax=Corynebacterium ulceribovis TaxID=487732 RepID=UPI0004766ABB|nr:hypothetical protein [Corynebacterium ulceribovis]
MSIRSRFQPELDEFIDNLNTYATGSYLREDERELWDEPFDPAAVPQVAEVLTNYLDALDKLGESGTEETVLAVMDSFTEKLNEVNARFEDAVIDDDERADIVALMTSAAHAAGLSSEHTDLKNREF